MLRRLALTVVLCGSAVPASSQDTPIVIVKHVEVPRYGQIARAARLEGSVSIHLRISASGKVLDAQASAADSSSKTHPLLQSDAVKFIQKWTFECLDCDVNADFQHTLVVTYRLEGEPTLYNYTTVTMDLPDRVTITANPPTVEPSNSSKKQKPKP